MRRRTRIPFDQQKLEQAPEHEIVLSGKTDFAGELRIQGKLVDLANLDVGDRLIYDGEKFVFSKPPSSSFEFVAVGSEGQTQFDISSLNAADVINMWVNGSKQEPGLDFDFQTGTLTFLELDFSLSPSDRVQIEYV